MVFGDTGSTAKWLTDSRIEVHGPGYSKVVLGPDASANYEKYIDTIVASIAENSGRSCVNASGVWVTSHANEIARAIAERLARIVPRLEDDPEAQLAPFANARAAAYFSGAVDSGLAEGGACEVTASLRDGKRLTVSMLRGEAGHQKKEFDHLSAWLDTQPSFSVALIPCTLLLGLAPALRARGLKVACELQGEDLFIDGLSEPSKSEAKALIAERAKDVDIFIAGSRYYADMMAADLKIPREKISVVPHGIDIDERLMTLKSAHSEEFTVGFFARIAPEKGLHVLADAYIRFRERRPERKARLAAGGYLAGEHRPYLVAIEDKLRAAGREPEFHYYGSPDREGKFEFLRSLDLLAAPTPYREPKGLFAMEAMACGVPVVLPRHGAFPELIEATDGGLLHTAGNEGELVEALECLADNHETRKAVGARGARAVRERFAAPLMAARTKDLLAGISG